MRLDAVKRFVFNDLRVTGPEMIVLTVMNSLLVIPNLLLSIFILVPSYALAAWLMSLTPLGTWVAAGLKLLYIYVQSEDLYKIGAALGFIRILFSKRGAGVKTKNAENNRSES